MVPIVVTPNEAQLPRLSYPATVWFYNTGQRMVLIRILTGDVSVVWTLDGGQSFAVDLDSDDVVSAFTLSDFSALSVSLGPVST